MCGVERSGNCLFCSTALLSAATASIEAGGSRLHPSHRETGESGEVQLSEPVVASAVYQPVVVVVVLVVLVVVAAAAAAVEPLYNRCSVESFPVHNHR